MKFRPCIDIHNGKVKQIVGNSLNDSDSIAKDNFISSLNAADYAKMYKNNGIYGGHAIILNSCESEYYKKDVEQVLSALREFPGGLQVGGGVNPDNALIYLSAGASHVIVTSYVFKEGRVNFDNLKKIFDVTGKSRLVLDLSCRMYNDKYHIVTDRWQKITEEVLDEGIIDKLSKYCDEFLIHAVDVEGQISGIDNGVLKIMSDEIKNNRKLKVTYAGGIHSYEDIKTIQTHGMDMIDFTVGSSLDLFGGDLSYKMLSERYK